MFQCLPITLLIFARNRLYVDIRRAFVSFELVLCLSLKSCFLFIFSTVFYMYVHYPWLVTLINTLLFEFDYTEWYL